MLSCRSKPFQKRESSTCCVPHVYNFKEIYELLNSYKISEEINNVAELSEKLANDLKELKNNENKITNSINDMGDRILSDTTKEIKKYLM